MFKTTKNMFLLCETPLHAGSGDDLGMVDLPIQRERHTAYPKIESSSLKGALREKLESHFGNRENAPEIVALFGPEDTKGDAHSGCLAVTDARILLFPVKSMRGVFVWATCTSVLGRFAKELGIVQNKALADVMKEWSGKKLKTGECLANAEVVGLNNNVVLEEYAFKIQGNANPLAEALANAIYADTPELAYWKKQLQTNLVVLHDDDFCDFAQQSTEVVTRIKIDNETGTVDDGALFTEEYLPSDAVLYSLVSTADEFKKRDDKLSSEQAMQKFEELLGKTNYIFQLGGNSTLGKGVLRAKLS